MLIITGLGALMVNSDTLASRERAAAPSAVLRETPTSGSATVGKLVSVAVSLTVSGDSTNAVEADVTYAVSQMKFVSATVNQAAWGLTVEKTGAAGKVRIAVGSFTPRTGTQAVATVTFRALRTGSFRFGIGATSAVMSATTNQNILRQPVTSTSVTNFAVCAAADSHPTVRDALTGVAGRACNSDESIAPLHARNELICSYEIARGNGQVVVTHLLRNGVLVLSTSSKYHAPSGHSYWWLDYKKEPSIDPSTYRCDVTLNGRLAASKSFAVSG